MNDPYPANITIEIDRPGLTKYLRSRALLAWVIASGILGGFATVGQLPKHAPDRFHSLNEFLFYLAKMGGAGMGISLIVALLGYLIVNHRIAGRTASSLELSVEGPFLRIRKHDIIRTDRKLHFSAIVDYMVTQDFMMRFFNLESLTMTTTGGGPASHVVIHGIKDCVKVRDMLSEIDRLRERK